MPSTRRLASTGSSPCGHASSWPGPLLQCGSRDEGRSLLIDRWTAAAHQGAAHFEHQPTALARHHRVPLWEGASGAPPRARPTEREAQILDQIESGATNREIATRLSIREKTISIHASHVLAKLSLKGRTKPPHSHDRPPLPVNEKWRTHTLRSPPSNNPRRLRHSGRGRPVLAASTGGEVAQVTAARLPTLKASRWRQLDHWRTAVQPRRSRRPVDGHNAPRYARLVIRSFGNLMTERLWSRERSKKIDPRIERTALRKLVLLDAAETLDDLRVPPGNRLEALRADRAGQHSIRINQQWRICFEWTPAGPENVEIVDYH